MAGIDFGDKAGRGNGSSGGVGGVLGRRVPVAGALGALVLGCFLGAGVFAVASGVSGVSGSASLSRTEASSGELDMVVGRYLFGGSWHDVTAREVIVTNSSVESATGESGSVRLPTADEVVSYCRNVLVDAEAKSRGIEVTGDALSKYAETMFGTSDMSEIAKAYDMDEDGAREVISASARSQKLREQVVESKSGDAPVAPEEPAVEGADKMSAEELESAKSAAAAKPAKKYADYIIKLVGDEWDATAGTWASADGAYAKALQSFEVTPDGATYEAAVTAYYLAYQTHQADASSDDAKWSEFVNGILDKACVEVYTLAI